MAALLARFPITGFFVLAYLGSWIAWSPWWLSRTGLGALPYELPFSAVAGINQLGLFAGPFAAALVMVRLTEGRAGLREFLRRMFRWRVPARWWFLALVAIPVATGIGYSLGAGSGSAPETGAGATVVLLVSTYAVYLLGGPLQEEPGWRGYALPRLQRRWSPVVSALVLGIVHCVWHAPLFLTDEWDTARQDPSQYLAYAILVVSMSVVMSWLANGSRGSILLAIVGHNGINWAIFAAGALGGERSADNWPAALGLAALAAAALAITRGRLGHRP